MRKIWFLLITVGLLLGCQAGGPPAPPPVPAGSFTLVGTVTSVNECNGRLGSIPANITVKAALTNAAGNVTVPGSVNIALDPVDGTAAARTGTYTITVQWPGGTLGAATTWRDFSETPVGGGDICCPIESECVDGAGRVPTKPVTQPHTTNDIRIRCGNFQ